MGGSETRREVELRESRADREGILETFADDEIRARLAGPEADGVAMQLPEDSFRALDFGQNAGGRVEIEQRTSGDLAPIVRDLCEQGRGPCCQIRIVLAPT